jgi:Putative peptidoglycan binding domain
VPRKSSKQNETSRRRGARAAVDLDAERGLAMRILLHSPKDTAVGALAFAAVAAIIANALFLQKGYHPAPMFGSVVVMPTGGLASTSPLPRPRPNEPEPAIGEPRITEPKPVEKAAEPKLPDPVGKLVKSASTPPPARSNILRPPAPVPISTHNEPSANSSPRRVAAVQRALTEYGYGQLKPSGTVGSDTRSAIQKFERDRNMPVTGQMSDRLVHELIAMIGHPID